MFDALSDTAVALNVGGENREVIPRRTRKHTPQSAEYGIVGAAIDNAFWARADSSLTTTHNVWFHEHVYTRQRFGDRDRSMEWFVEASTEYYAARLSYELGLVGRLEYEWEFKSRRIGTDEDVLAEPSTWGSPNTPYRKDALVLAALDAEIKETPTATRPSRPCSVDSTVRVGTSPTRGSSRSATIRRWKNGSIGTWKEPKPHSTMRDPAERLPNPPRKDEVVALILSTPLGFAFGTLVVLGVSMGTISAVSLLGRRTRRTVGGWLGTAGRAIEQLFDELRQS